MGEYQIVCIIHDEKKVITKVGLKGSSNRYGVDVIIDWIRQRKHTFFTMVDGHRADVYARQHPVTKRWYITTSRDGTTRNNLDNLPQCK